MLAQNDVADRVGTTKQKMSRVEQGRTAVDTLLLQKLSTVLGIERERLLSLVDAGIVRTQAIARQLLRLPVKGWWEGLQAKAGDMGTAGMVSVAVSLVLSEEGA